MENKSINPLTVYRLTPVGQLFFAKQYPSAAYRDKRQNMCFPKLIDKETAQKLLYTISTTPEKMKKVLFEKDPNYILIKRALRLAERLQKVYPAAREHVWTKYSAEINTR